MIYIYDGGSLSVTEEEEKKKKKDFYSSSIRLGYCRTHSVLYPNLHTIVNISLKSLLKFLLVV